MLPNPERFIEGFLFFARRHAPLRTVELDLLRTRVVLGAMTFDDLRDALGRRLRARS